MGWLPSWLNNADRQVIRNVELDKDVSRYTAREAASNRRLEAREARRKNKDNKK